MAPTQRQEYDSALQTSEEQSSDFPEEFDTLNLACYPANSVRYRLTRAFIATLEVPEAGYRITSFGKYMRDIPRYVGESPALDAAAACLANAHSNVMQHPECRGKQVADPVLYLKALQRLQEAIVDPKTGMSTYTLAATILLGIVEVSDRLLRPFSLLWAAVLTAFPGLDSRRCATGFKSLESCWRYN